MYSKASSSAIPEKVALLIAETKRLRASGPHFRIVHRFRLPGTLCLPGEEVFAIFLMYRGRQYHLRLSGSLRVLFDFLARHPLIPQSARQIELGILADDFYAQHGLNAGRQGKLPRRISRTAVKEYIRRLHQALELVFEEASLGIDPLRVLVVEGTVGNEVGYQLKASCTWMHIDLRGTEAQPII